MKQIDKLRSYILENEFKMTILENKIDIVNYISIEHFDLNKIIVKYEKGYITINGTNLVVTKLVTDEILITGVIKNIELR